MAENVKVLIIGATGYIGQHIAAAAAAEPGVTALALVSKATLEKPERAAAVQKLRNTPNLSIVEGDISDHANLIAILKQVSVVISAVGFAAVLDQQKILDAAKEAGTITRFLPSEFGMELSQKTMEDLVLGSQKTMEDLGEVHPLFAEKEVIARAAKESGIPYTLVYANGFAGYWVTNLGSLSPIQNDEVTVYGTGEVKGVFLDEGDIGKYTIRAALDPRAANKVVRLDPPRNVLSQNELIALGEKARGKTYKKQHVSAESLLEAYKSGEGAAKMGPLLVYAVWIAGEHTAPKQEGHVSSADLYPDVQYKTVESILQA